MLSNNPIGIFLSVFILVNIIAFIWLITRRKSEEFDIVEAMTLLGRLEILLWFSVLLPAFLWYLSISISKTKGDKHKVMFMLSLAPAMLVTILLVAMFVQSVLA